MGFTVHPADLNNAAVNALSTPPLKPITAVLILCKFLYVLSSCSSLTPIGINFLVD
jgi:hypothetical protein